MPLSASEAKAAFLEFGKDTQKIANDLYKVVKRPVPPEQKEAAVSAGRKKLQAYDDLLSAVSETWKTEAADRFGHHIDSIREFLAKATDGPA